MKTSEFDFDLPLELIAQEPFFPKEKTKMLVFDGNNIRDQEVINLVDHLRAQDVLVFNDARVIKAQIKAAIERNQAQININLDQQLQDGSWSCLCRPAKKVQGGDILQIADGFSAKVLAKKDDGVIEIVFNKSQDELFQCLEDYGSVPLPPYIKRERQRESDKENYQTIYAKQGTAVAAPTAGLHFNQKIFDLIDQKGIKKAFITLNVGAGTFLPVKSDEIKDHKMHHESFSISESSANIINSARQEGGRVVAVGTTSLRALESVASEDGLVSSCTASTNIFIHPPYKFKIVDILMTNFHLPKSTLFMLICAFVGYKRAYEIYNHAIDKKYRFYSYGDSSLLYQK